MGHYLQHTRTTFAHHHQAYVGNCADDVKCRWDGTACAFLYHIAAKFRTSCTCCGMGVRRMHAPPTWTDRAYSRTLPAPAPTTHCLSVDASAATAPRASPHRAHAPHACAAPRAANAALFLRHSLPRTAAPRTLLPPSTCRRHTGCCHTARAAARTVPPLTTPWRFRCCTRYRCTFARTTDSV